jgi:hypothetical protein
MTPEALARLERILAWSLGSILALYAMVVVFYAAGWAWFAVSAWMHGLFATR